MDSWKLAQEKSLLTASKLGEGWTLADLNLVAEWKDEPVAVVAELLHRSVYSITAIRQAIEAGTAGSQRNQPAKREEPSYDFVTTFPLGWND